jgi:hypothetical protein
MAVKALHELLGLKPDHLPSLKALARASDQAKDRAGARFALTVASPRWRVTRPKPPMRTCTSLGSARRPKTTSPELACTAKRRCAWRPIIPTRCYQLGELCFRSGEHLRAVKALDRLREVAMGRHEVDRVGRANLLAGRVWETGLKQPENALLRFREAASR